MTYGEGKRKEAKGVHGWSFRNVEGRCYRWVAQSSSPIRCPYHGLLPLKGAYVTFALHFSIRQEGQIRKTKLHLKEFEPLGWNNLFIFYKFCDFLGGWKQKRTLWVKNKNHQICFRRNLKLCHANPLSELMSLFQRVYLLKISFTSPLRIMLVFNAF